MGADVGQQLSGAICLGAQLRSQKSQLASLASEMNRAKIVAAPLTVIVGYDLAFPETMPKLFPARGEMMRQASYSRESPRLLPCAMGVCSTRSRSAMGPSDQPRNLTVLTAMHQVIGVSIKAYSATMRPSRTVTTSSPVTLGGSPTGPWPQARRPTS